MQLLLTASVWVHPFSEAGMVKTEVAEEAPVTVSGWVPQLVIVIGWSEDVPAVTE